ncbi:glycosyltransferase family 87 protein [Mycobacterium sp.]|uniref:glycosyltransferase family 87 protein n=1 Tax=Mycobacterium sp. TaxID=1785 RepID=UPI003A86E322
MLLLTSISFATCLVLSHYFSADVLSSLLYQPYDCLPIQAIKVGRHCFGDYSLPLVLGMEANPWAPYPLHLPPELDVIYNNYSAGAMLPMVAFGAVGKWLGAPLAGMVGYLIALTAACLIPAIWAARGAIGLERIVVFMICGAAAVPVWMTVDRGNAVGFAVPAMLYYLVALCRQRWGLVAAMVILAALIKPQFAVLGCVLFTARQWRMAAIAVAGGVISNVAAYALWPRDFPGTILQSIHNTAQYGSDALLFSDQNVSFGKGLFTIIDGVEGALNGGMLPDNFLIRPRLLAGSAVLVLVVVALVALGRRIPPVMAGAVLLATASLFPAVSNRYYLVFALPIAALVVRDPDGPPATGIFERLAVVGGRRRLVGICVSLAAAVTIAQIAIPGPLFHWSIYSPQGDLWAVVSLVRTTAEFAPILWLVTICVTLVSYALHPAPAIGDAPVDCGEPHRAR